MKSDINRIKTSLPDSRLISWRGILSVALLGSLITGHANLASEPDDSPPAGPVIEFVEDAMDLGTLTLADLQSFERDIEFVNRGDQPLILSNVRGCCGTRITSWPQAPIMPGETGRVSTQFRLASRPHTVRRTVTFTSNATEPNKVYRIIGNVIAGETQPQDAPSIGPQMLFLEDRIDLGTLSVDETGELRSRIEFENQGDQPLILSNVRGGSGAAVLDWPRDPIQPGNRGVIDLEVRVENRPHAFNQYVFIVANTESRRYVYRISGTVAAP